MEPDSLNRRAVRRKFDRAASLYDKHSVLEQEVASRLIDRLEFHRLTPQRIVDLGCGTGQASVGLKDQFPKAKVIGLDSSYAMLVQMQQGSHGNQQVRAVCGELLELPLADHSAELLFSNLALQWCPDIASLFGEFRRVLAPGGMLLFSSFGPATLSELRVAWAAADKFAQAVEFVDVLQVGDTMMAAGFQDPVVDTEQITLSYRNFDSLLRELEATVTSGFLQGGSSLTEAKTALENAYEPFVIDGKYPVTYEIIYGTAFGPQEGQPRRTPEGDVATFSVDYLRHSGSK
jgi:malonyl-CoA O-methyltransferase